MYTGNIKTNLIHSFLSLALAGGIAGGNEPKFTSTTSIALCLADSLIQCYLASSKGKSQTEGDAIFNIRHQATQYIRWWRQGHLSASQEPSPDITTQTALGVWEDGLKKGLTTAEILANVKSTQLQENLPTSVVWVLPIALVFWRDRSKASELARTATDVLSPAFRDLAGWYVAAVAAVLWESAENQTSKIGKASLHAQFEAEYKRLQLHDTEMAEDVHKGVEIFLLTNTFGDGLKIAIRSSPEVAMAYAGIAGAWYGTGVKDEILQRPVGYGVVEKVVGGLGALSKVLERKEDDEMQIIAARVPLDDEHEGVL